MLLAAGFYVAYKMENRLQNQRTEKKTVKAEEENLLDTTLEDSFPASDPPNFSSNQYHH
jgi:hypothetical protein